jgi:hypothetical protein
LAELDADGLANIDEQQYAWEQSNTDDVTDSAGNWGLSAIENILFIGALAAKGIANDAADAVAYHAVHGTGSQDPNEALWKSARNAERAVQCGLIRDLFGPLLFRPRVVYPTWLRWHDGAIVHIAQAIYNDRRFQELPILADALEEAGWTDREILGHCREPGDHVRGCWVVDLILGKG